LEKYSTREKKMRLTVKHWQIILFMDSQDVDERCCGWQKNSIILYRLDEASAGFGGGKYGVVTERE